MIRSLNLEIFTPEAFTERETKLIETLVLNMAATLNAIVTKKGVALNPIPNSEAKFSLELVFQESISDEDASQLQGLLERRFISCFKMSQLEEPTVLVKTTVSSL